MQKEMDAKTAQSYFLGPTSMNMIISLCDSMREKEKEMQ